MTDQRKIIIGGASFLTAVGFTLAINIILSLTRGSITESANYVLTNIMQFINQLLFLGGVVFFSKINRVKMDYTAKPTLKFAAIAAAVAVLSIICFYLITTLYSEGLRAIGYNSGGIKLNSPSDWVIICIRAVLITPICEEILFRGAFLTAMRVLFRPIKYGDIFAVLLSAAAFMLMHMNPAQVVFQFSLGVVLAVLTICSRSVIPAIIAHSFCNLFAILLETPFLKVILIGISIFYSALPALFIPLALILFILGLVLAIIALLKFAPSIKPLIYNNTSNNIRSSGAESSEHTFSGSRAGAFAYNYKLIGIMCIITATVICTVMFVIQLLYGMGVIL